MIHSLAAVALLSALLPDVSVATPKVTDVVDQVVAAYGGKTTLAAMHAVRMTGSVVSPMRGKGDLVRELERPDRLRVDVHYSAAREVRLLDGAKAFQNGKPVTGMAADAMALQALRLDLPALLAKKREQVRDLGTVDVDGLKTRKLGLSLDRGMELVAFVDPATFHIVRSETSVGAADARMTFASNYADFRSVAGVLFAFAEDNFAGTMATGKTRLDKIEVLPSLPKETWDASR